MNYSVFNEFRIIIDHYCSSPHVELPAAIFICAKLALKSLTVNRASDFITGLGNSRCLDIYQIDGRPWRREPEAELLDSAKYMVM